MNKSSGGVALMGSLANGEVSSFEIFRLPGRGALVPGKAWDRGWHPGIPLSDPAF